MWYRFWGLADEGEEDVLEGGLFLDVLDRRRWEELLEFGQGAVLDDRAAVQDRDPISQMLGLVQGLSRQQHGDAVVGEVSDGLPDLVARLRVQSGGRLVEEDDRRVADQAHRDVEPATHPAGVGGRLPGPRLGQSESGQQVVGDLVRILQVAQPGDQDQVFPAGEHLVDCSELAGQADRLPHLQGFGGDVEVLDDRGAGVGLEQRRQYPHQGRLAGSVGAEQGEDAAACNLEVDAAQHRQILERLLNAAHPNRC